MQCKPPACRNTTDFRLVHPSNQITCFHRIFLATFAQAFRDPVNSPTSSLMAGPTGLFDFTSLRAPFAEAHHRFNTLYYTI
jgi:hypothetical protein